MERVRDILFFVFGSVLITLSVFGQSAVSLGERSKQADAARAEVLKFEEEGRVRSLKGETNWDDMIAEGAFMISPDGAAFTFKRGQAMPSLPLKDFKITDLIARVFGDAVVVTGLALLEGVAKDNKQFSVQMRYTNIWTRIEGSWKIVVSERTTVKDSFKLAAQ